MQLKFILIGDPLLHEEESRSKFITPAMEPEEDKRPGFVSHAVYMAEFEFENVKRISY